ncbi:MAG TPA: 2-amino-4-hydroxy-6-hydroxymethyldihydropteridine diphosphokinase [Actinomycetota bacterium]|nr:2-amino-4-hydroxy-6-hydroxymethyldihydropteridine diphosphokinase [Actinomycetota bacterium]
MTVPRSDRVARVYIGLGSNLGDRLSNLRTAVEQLSSLMPQIVGVSSVYETEPVGPEQPDYLNAVVCADTDLAPEALLAAMQQIESKLGRTRMTRWGPRTIDLDLLLYGDQIINSKDLKVPHPEITNRAFVLVPLLELQPGLNLPSGEALADFNRVETPGVRLFASPDALVG